MQGAKEERCQIRLDLAGELPNHSGLVWFGLQHHSVEITWLSTSQRRILQLPRTVCNHLICQNSFFLYRLRYQRKTLNDICLTYHGPQMAIDVKWTVDPWNLDPAGKSQRTTIKTIHAIEIFLSRSLAVVASSIFSAERAPMPYVHLSFPWSS